jgi:molecular chaperone DnaK
MKKDAEAHAEEDHKRREEVEVKNQADSLAYAAEKTVRESGEKIPADVRGDIEARTKDLRDALGSDAGTDAIKGAMEGLSAALQQAGSAVYSGPGEEPEVGGGPAPEEGGEEEGGAEEGTVEGEYREV